MIDFGKAMLDAMFFTDAVEQMSESPFVLEAIGKLDAVVGNNSMNTLRHGVNQPA
jgi:hypothetical protein